MGFRLKLNVNKKQVQQMYITQNPEISKLIYSMVLMKGSFLEIFMKFEAYENKDRLESKVNKFPSMFLSCKGFIITRTFPFGSVS